MRLESPATRLQTLFWPLAAVALLAVACRPVAPGAVTATQSATATQPAPTTAAPVAEALPGGDLMPAETAAATLEALLGDSAADKRAALAGIRTSGDTRFVAVLIELMRAIQIGMVTRLDYNLVVETLEAISGQAYGGDWPAWIEWYGASQLKPPPGFTTWKGRLLSEIDPAFGEFLQDAYPSRIRVEEIQWGGVLVDGIPALDNPATLTPEQAGYLLPEEPVFGLYLNGEARAYPLRILDWHEMANDVVGGVPVSLAYCTLCGAGIAYDGRAPNGETYTFGSSGFLFRSNKLMYDRQTRTLWNQLTGEPVMGELAAGDLRLEFLPVVLTSWSDWLARHPDTRVLDVETGYSRPYQLGAAYGGYFASQDTMFPVWQRSDLLDTKARIFAMRLDGVPKAYSLEALERVGVLNDTLGATDLVVVARRGSITVQGSAARGGAVDYDAGGEVRAYARQGWTFEAAEGADELLDSQGGRWQVSDEALLGPNGESLPRLPGHLAYWFGWFAFFPQTELYK